MIFYTHCWNPGTLNHSGVSEGNVLLAMLRVITAPRLEHPPLRVSLFTPTRWPPAGVPPLRDCQSCRNGLRSWLWSVETQRVMTLTPSLPTRKPWMISTGQRNDIICLWGAPRYLTSSLASGVLEARGWAESGVGREVISGSLAFSFVDLKFKVVMPLQRLSPN